MNPSTFVGTSRYSQLIRSELWWNHDNDEHTSWAKQSCDHYRWYKIVGFRTIQITYCGKISNMPCEIQVAEMTGSPVAQTVHPWPLRNLRFQGPTLTFWMCLRQHTQKSYTANPRLNHCQNEHLHRTCWTMLNHNVNQNRWARIVPLASASKQLAEVYLRSEGHGITIHGAP